MKEYLNNRTFPNTEHFSCSCDSVKHLHEKFLVSIVGYGYNRLIGHLSFNRFTKKTIILIVFMFNWLY